MSAADLERHALAELVEVWPELVTDVARPALASAMAAATERLVALELDRIYHASTPARAVTGVRRLASRLAELADVLDGRTMNERAVAA